MLHLALRQGMADEHGVDCLQIELGSKIHHREVFVIKFAVLLHRITVAFDEMQEQIAMRLKMPIEIHADEAVELEEARINLAHAAGMRERHLADHIATEPIEA